MLISLWVPEGASQLLQLDPLAANRKKLCARVTHDVRTVGTGTTRPLTGFKGRS